MLFSEAGMDWWDKLVAKLPSWRGVAYFWYVAAHWENISREFEEYRKRIRDREEWAQRALEGQQVLHQQEKQRLEGELRDTLTREVAGRIVAEQEAAQYRAAFDGAIRSVVNEAMVLGTLLSVLPEDFRRGVLASLHPGPREIVERVLATIQATAPPEPTPPPGLSPPTGGLALTGHPPTLSGKREEPRSGPTGG